MFIVRSECSAAVWSLRSSYLRARYPSEALGGAPSRLPDTQPQLGGLQFEGIAFNGGHPYASTLDGALPIGFHKCMGLERSNRTVPLRQPTRPPLPMIYRNATANVAPTYSIEMA